MFSVVEETTAFVTNPEVLALLREKAAHRQGLLSPASLSESQARPCRALRAPFACWREMWADGAARGAGCGVPGAPEPARPLRQRPASFHTGCGGAAVQPRGPRCG